MSTNDEVKVSIGEGNKNNNEPAKSVMKKTAIKRKVAGKKPPITKTASKAGNGGGWLRFLITVMITAAVVGGGIYAWQKKAGDAVLTKARQETQEVKTSFEQRLQNLKSQLTGTETEKEQLAEKTKELEARVQLLNKAKIDFRDDELGLSFSYPAVFGDLTVTKTDVASGTKFTGTWEDNKSLVFGGVSVDLAPEAAGTTTALAVTDTQGYVERRRILYFRGPDGKEFEIKPTQEIPFEGGTALLIDKNSFVADPQADGLPVAIGDNAAAIVNLGGDEFPGTAFVDSDFSAMPLESFIGMIKSIKINK